MCHAKHAHVLGELYSPPQLSKAECTEKWSFPGAMQTNQFSECSIDSDVLPASDVGKCLGNWWSGDKMATKAAKENLKKTRRTVWWL